MMKQLTLIDYGFTTTKGVKVEYQMNDFPNELIVMIFKCLTPSQRRKMITVCHRWLNIVNLYFSQDHCLILKNSIDYSLFGSLYQTFFRRLTNTKHLRTFSHLIVDTLPERSRELLYLLKFLELIGGEIRDLQLKNLWRYKHKIKKDFIKSFYSKLPNINKLELKDGNDDFFKYLPSDTNVKTVKMSSTLYHLTTLEHLRKIKTIKTLTVCELSIGFPELENKMDEMNFMQIEAVRALNAIFGDTGDSALSLISNFNFSGEEKMSLNDVEEIQIMDCETSLKPNTFDQFKNLKRLVLSRYTDEPYVSITERGNYFGITHLTFEGLDAMSFPNIDKFLQSFPNLEYLNFDEFICEARIFSIICQFMPKLKDFIIEGCHSHKLCVSELLAEENYSLKDLNFLERLMIRTDDEIIDVNNLQWPRLPNLKELSLFGRSFQPFGKKFYYQIAQNSPKLTHITIEYHHQQKVVENNFKKFIPLLENLKITHLSLPGNNSNAALIDIIVPYCRDLKFLSINNIDEFSLSDELFLFKSLPSLETIESRIGQDNFPHKRIMTRKDSENLKPYLKRNLGLYKKLLITSHYIIDNFL